VWAYPGGGEDLYVGLVVLPGESGDLNLLRAQLCHVQGFTQNLNHEEN
jgi:hypothetical protein